MVLDSWARKLASAALTGQILNTAGVPLPGVTVSVRGHKARTNRLGRFRLTGLPQGMQALEMDGRTASTRRRSFGVFDVQVRLRAGRTGCRSPRISLYSTPDMRSR